MGAVRKMKIKSIKFIEQKYDTDIDIFNEIGANFDNSPRGLKFQDWMGDKGNTKCVMAYNRNDKNVKSLYQPGGTGIRVKSRSKDNKWMGDKIDGNNKDTKNRIL